MDILASLLHVNLIIVRGPKLQRVFRPFPKKQIATSLEGSYDEFPYTKNSQDET